MNPKKAALIQVRFLFCFSPISCYAVLHDHTYQMWTLTLLIVNFCYHPFLSHVKLWFLS
jgi:hypothetical protein